jgi:hypothetical protein
MRAVQEVMASIKDHTDRATRLELHRYNFAAALDARLHGQEVTSVADAGDIAREEGKQFDPDCPTLNGAEAQLEQQGFIGEVLCTCPFCGKKVKIDPCSPQIRCSACTAEVRNGVVVSEGTTREKAQKKVLGGAAIAAAVQTSEEKQVARVGDIMRSPTGKKLELQQNVVVGGVVRYWVDIETGEAVAHVSSN